MVLGSARRQGCIACRTLPSPGRCQPPVEIEVKLISWLADVKQLPFRHEFMNAHRSAPGFRLAQHRYLVTVTFVRSIAKRVRSRDRIGQLNIDVGAAAEYSQVTSIYSSVSNCATAINFIIFLD